jgi:hypothetical protein
MGLVASVCQPSTLRMLIWPEASSAQNNMAAVSADGSTVCVLVRHDSVLPGHWFVANAKEIKSIEVRPSRDGTDIRRKVVSRHFVCQPFPGRSVEAVVRQRREREATQKDASFGRAYGGAKDKMRSGTPHGLLVRSAGKDACEPRGNVRFNSAHCRRDWLCRPSEGLLS